MFGHVVAVGHAMCCKRWAFETLTMHRAHSCCCCCRFVKRRALLTISSGMRAFLRACICRCTYIFICRIVVAQNARQIVIRETLEAVTPPSVSSVLCGLRARVRRAIKLMICEQSTITRTAYRVHEEIESTTSCSEAPRFQTPPPPSAPSVLRLFHAEMGAGFLWAVDEA